MKKSRITDLSFLRSFTLDDRGKMTKYIKLFLTYAPVQLSAIEHNLKEKNWNDLKIAAHSLKPQLKYMGINDLESVIVAIEDCAANRQGLDKLPGLVRKLNDDCSRAMDELKEELTVNNQF